jgi:hypothetical protein
MKLKALAILTISSLFAASFAFADDASGMSGTSGSMSGNIGAMNNNDMQQTQNTNAPTPPGPADTSNSNDDMSADTATGDDDY